MNKAFFSHSSFDREFVSSVYDLLGARHCIYDIKSFEKNADLTKQIKDGLESCDTYVLFLSKNAINSKWVNSEINVAEELKTKWGLKRFMVFQLDDTPHDLLPSWLHSQVLSCPPSPAHVAQRIKDEMTYQSYDECYGREDEVAGIIEEIEEQERVPSFIYLSGPVGIGRRSVLSKIYKDYYPGVSFNNFMIELDLYDGLFELYSKLLPYSANWSIYKKSEEEKCFLSLKDYDSQILEVIRLITKITISFNQVLIINLGTSSFDEERRPSSTFKSLANNLSSDNYPYICFISQRYMSGSDYRLGVFFQIDPMDQSKSKLLFRTLLQNKRIKIPSHKEKKSIENLIIGHPGIIKAVVQYLRKNPKYKPNKTHGKLVEKIAEQTKQIIQDFIGDSIESAQCIAFYAEAGIVEYNEVLHVAKEWESLENTTSDLLDCGFLVYEDGYYFLANFIRQYSFDLAKKHRDFLKPHIVNLVINYTNPKEEDILDSTLMSQRILNYLLCGGEVNDLFKTLIYPSQRLRASKQMYDKQHYQKSLSLAKESYEESSKLSKAGEIEAWRLIGLSSIRLSNHKDFGFFEKEYPKFKKSPYVEKNYLFALGLKSRMNGSYKKALEFYEKINPKFADHHVYRELAKIYAFDRSYEKALDFTGRALKHNSNNSYILEMKVLILMMLYRSNKDSRLVDDIYDCLDSLKISDEAHGTNFYAPRERMMQIVVNKDSILLEDFFRSRRNGATIGSKVFLLEELFRNDKEHYFNELLNEIKIEIRRKPNPSVQMEIERIEIEYKCLHGSFDDARVLLQKNKDKYTDHCYQDLVRQLR